MPEGHDADNFRKVVLENFDMSLGTGLNKIKGKVFRIGHLGDLNELMLLGAIAGAEMAMRDVGMTQIVPGSGVGAASEYWRTGGAAASAPAPASAEKRQAPAVAAR